MMLSISNKNGLILTISVFLSTSLSCNTSQANEKNNYISIISENDIYAPKAQDRHYSNGFRIGYGILDKKEAWYRMLEKYSTLAGSRDRVHYELTFGQNIYTPEDYLAEELQVDDRPFAGWLYGGVIATSHAPGKEESIAVNIGIVGPAALGEAIQKLNHTITGDNKPRGWHNQLKNEPSLQIRYQRSHFTKSLNINGIKLDAVTRIGVNLGNVFTDGGLGLSLRMGNHLPESDQILRIQPGLSGNSSYVPIRNTDSDWMIFTEIQGRAIARNIFLDGNTFTKSHSVNKEHFVWEAATGLLLGFGHFKYPLHISFSVVWRGKEFDMQSGFDNFGSAQIGFEF